MRQLSAGIVISAVALELVPVMEEAPKDQIWAILVGFGSGLGMFFALDACLPSEDAHPHHEIATQEATAASRGEADTEERLRGFKPAAPQEAGREHTQRSSASVSRPMQSSRRSIFSSRRALQQSADAYRRQVLNSGAVPGASAAGDDGNGLSRVATQSLPAQFGTAANPPRTGLRPVSAGGGTDAGMDPATAQWPVLHARVSGVPATDAASSDGPADPASQKALAGPDPAGNAHEPLLDRRAPTELALPPFPWSFATAVIINTIIDGALIGITVASSEAAGAGLVMTVALTVDNSFLVMSFSSCLVRHPRSTRILAAVLPPCTVLFGCVLGAAVASQAGPGTALNTLLVSFGVAALLHLVTCELIVEAHELAEKHGGHLWWIDCAFFAGFIMSFVLEKYHE
jgi:zinc transporter ZupT